MRFSLVPSSLLLGLTVLSVVSLFHCGSDPSKTASGGAAGTFPVATGGQSGAAGASGAPAGTPLPSSGGRLTLNTSCATTAACGGDLTGTWKLTAQCVSAGKDPALLSTRQAIETTLLQCDSAKAEAWLDMAGTIEFRNDGTYQTSSTASFSTKLQVPKTCLIGGTCTNDQGFAFEDRGKLCDLLTVEDISGSPETGSYQVTPNGEVMLKAQPPATSSVWKQVCVKGNVAHAVTEFQQGGSVVLLLTRQGM